MTAPPPGWPDPTTRIAAELPVHLLLGSDWIQHWLRLAKIQPEYADARLTGRPYQVGTDDEGFVLVARVVMVPGTAARPLLYWQRELPPQTGATKDQKADKPAGIPHRREPGQTTVGAGKRRIIRLGDNQLATKAAHSPSGETRTIPLQRFIFDRAMREGEALRFGDNIVTK
jgi:hypothetical protein